MDDATFAIFMFGITSLAMLSLLMFSYVISTYLLNDDDLNSMQNNLPNNLKVNFDNFSKLQTNDLSLFANLSKDEKITYILSTIYGKLNKSVLIPNELNSNKITTESLLIRDRGINSFHFNDYYDQIQPLIDQLKNELHDNADESTSLLNNSSMEENFKNNNLLTVLESLDYKASLPTKLPYIIEDLLEINFNKFQINNKLSYSTVLNLPVPIVNRKQNTTYFECKLLKFNKLSTLVSIGLSNDPKYPNFQLPGYLPYSFAIESSGNLRLTTSSSTSLIPYDNINDELIVLPQLNEGDVIGLGYKAISGTIFLTHNGKLIHEMVKYFKFQLFPVVGYKSITGDSTECKISVNLGQLGFVYIEANVKKLGFCENKNDGLIGAPPIYNKVNLTNEILLAKGDDIPPNYANTDDDSFFGPLVGSSKDNEKDVLKLEQKKLLNNTKESTPESEPPSYESEKDVQLNDGEYERLVSTSNENETGNDNDNGSESNNQATQSSSTAENNEEESSLSATTPLVSSKPKTTAKGKKGGKKSGKKKNKKKNKTLF